MRLFSVLFPPSIPLSFSHAMAASSSSSSSLLYSSLILSPSPSPSPSPRQHSCAKLFLKHPASFSDRLAISSSSSLLFRPLHSCKKFNERRKGVCSSGNISRIFVTNSSSDPEQLKKARDDIKELIKETYCSPILIRLGWHDAGTYDKSIEDWPARGGANGSLSYEIVQKHAANAGLNNALKLITPIKEKYPTITWADLFQLASATAIEEAGGPKIPMKYGRIDIPGPEACPPEGNLPDAGPPSPADHLRKVFYRMGFSDKEIVALSGAHTLGRSRPERSGWGKSSTKYTKDGPGNPGGQSWTQQWLQFDNSYFKEIKAKRDEDLLVLPTDAVLFEDAGFKVYAEKYAEDQEAFFKDYAEAHAKLSELGAKFDPPQGVFIDEPSSQPSKQPVPEKFVASQYSSGENRTALSDAMKAKIRDEYLGLGGSPNRPMKSNYFLNIIIIVAVLAILSSLATNNFSGL